MNHKIRTAVALAAAGALLATFVPAAALADGTGARLEGLMLGVDGTPAEGFRVLLIDEQGEVVSRAATAADGMYRFRDLAAGSYGLGIENPEGLAAPVQSEPARLADGELVRLDIRLMEAGSEAGLAPGQSQPKPKGLGVWWAGLTKKAKITYLAALGVVVTWGTVELLDDDDDEGPASASVPD